MVVHIKQGRRVWQQHIHQHIHRPSPLPPAASSGQVVQLVQRGLMHGGGGINHHAADAVGLDLRGGRRIDYAGWHYEEVTFAAPSEPLVSDTKGIRFGGGLIVVVGRTLSHLARCAWYAWEGF